MTDLKGACDQVVADPELAPRGGKTYCNVAARRVASAMGFQMEVMLANAMIEYLAKNPSWKEASLEDAAAHAVLGKLAFVALSEEPHGHLAPLYPSPAAESGSWGQKVPIIANVGKTNGIMRLSGAFKAADKGKLRYFLYA